jgi:signal transduction histidine kinase
MPQFQESRSAGDAAAPLARRSLPEGPELLHHLTETGVSLTGAAAGWIARRLPQPGRVEVVGSAGTGAPAIGTRLELPQSSPPTRMVLPLAIGQAVPGVLVVEGLRGAIPAAAQRELALLGAAAALALGNQSLLARAEAEAAGEARRQYQLLSGTIYHLKNALANSSEYLELLGMDAELSSTQQEYVARSRRSVGLALRLLTELHDLGMADSGQLLPQREPVEMGVLIRDLTQDHRLAAGTTTVSFALELPPLPGVHTDADCVRQILHTLLSNAIRYSPPDGVITVRCLLVSGRRSGDPDRWLRIDVADMGPGVMEQEAVFEEVQRVSRKGPPGFRLAIARRLARLLGGDLILETAPGEGATFSLWLPVAD